MAADIRWMAVLVVALAIACLPLATSATPPLFDYPNHLARVDAIARYATDPVLQDNYVLSGFAIPNVLSDLVLLALMQVEDPDAAGRHLLLATFVLTFTGITALGRAASKAWSPWSLLAALFLTNEMFFWGFLNYNLGLGLLPWALAAWLHFGETERPGARFAVGLAAAFLLFFAHLVVFALYAVAVAILALLWASRNLRRGGRSILGHLVLSALPILAVVAFWMAGSPAGRLPLNPHFDFSLWGKFSPFSRVLSSGNPGMDTAQLGACVALVLQALATGRARLDTGLALVALVFAGLVLVLPFTMLGSFFLDARIAVAAALIGVAAIAPVRRRLSDHTGEIAILLALVVLRSAVLVSDWHRQDAEIAGVREAFRAIPEGSIAIAASAEHFELGDWQATRRISPAHEHTIAYTSIDRHALVPTLFAREGQNPLVWTPSTAAIGALERNPLPRLFSPDDYRRFVEPAAAVAAEAGRTGPAVYAVAFFATCDEWPAGLPVAPVVCGRDFSIMHVTASAGSFPGAPPAGRSP